MNTRRRQAFGTIRRSLIFTRNVWVICGLVVVLLGAIELVSSLIVNTKVKLTTPAVDYRIEADSYADAPWAEAYFREFHEIRTGWQPYVHYRRYPYSGRYITIDANRHRRTAYPKIENAASAPLKIFMFGASTMWGTGARDEHTVASAVGRALTEAGIAAEVTNFAESGYVSTQELITLMLELRKGNVPDLAIFYDGVNDTFAAFQTGVAGLPMNEYRRVREFNLLHESRRGDLTKMYLVSHLERSGTVRLLQALVRRLRPNLEYKERQRARKQGSGVAVEEAVVATWIANMEIVERLGETYGFTPIFYWQPVIYTKDELSEYEKGELEKKKEMEGFFETTYAYFERDLSKLAGRRFFDVSDIFKDTTEPCYIDFAHVSEAANAIVGRRMADDIREIAGR